jgi:F0F1-type ATP synthase membrane subunit b/b'
MKTVATVLCLLLTAPAFAQQPPDPAFLQKAIQVLQAHRNEAQDLRAQAEARLALSADEVAKLQAEVKRLTDKYEPKPPAKE